MGTPSTGVTSAGNCSVTRVRAGCSSGWATLDVHSVTAGTLRWWARLAKDYEGLFSGRAIAFCERRRNYV